jgi:hypothetical protein
MHLKAWFIKEKRIIKEENKFRASTVKIKFIKIIWKLWKCKRRLNLINKTKNEKNKNWIAKLDKRCKKEFKNDEEK